MGRPRKAKTKKEVAAQKKKWRENSNRKRRARYKTDSAYRNEVKDRARSNARKQNQTKQEKASECREAAQRLSSFGDRREPTGGGEKTLTLTSSELAEAMGLGHVTTLHKWQREGRFPKPTRSYFVARTHTDVYSESEAQTLLLMLADHYDKKLYLSQKDTATIEKLHSAVA